MANLHGRKFGLELCEVFGLDPHNVNSIRLEVNMDDAVFIVVKRFVSTDEAEKVEEILQGYSLLPNGIPTMGGVFYNPVEEENHGV